MGYIYLFFIIFNTSLGQVFLKQHNINNNHIISLYLIVGILLLISVPILTYLALNYLPFNIVFLSDSLSIVSVILLSSIFLDETISNNKILGSVLVISGMLLFGCLL
jgi:uncharacterized membrane protein